MERSGTVDKAVRALELLHAAPSALLLAEVARGLALPKPTVHRLLATLVSHQLVEQDAHGRYGLGVGLLRLGLGAQQRDPVVRVARPSLEAAARALGETFFLVLARAGSLTVVDKVEGTGVLRVAPDVGADVPVAETASGRLYLAHAPERVAFSGRMTKELAAAVARAKRRGYDLNEGDWIDGLSVVAAPILTHGQLHGCIACAVVAARWERTLARRAIEQVQLAAESAQRALLGPRGESP